MFTLIAIGTGVAWTYSAIAILFPQIFPEALKDVNGLIPVYFEAAAIIIVLVLLGQMLELKARESTGDAIKALLGLAPKTAILVEDGQDDREIALDEIKIGMRLRVRSGKIISGWADCRRSKPY